MACQNVSDRDWRSKTHKQTQRNTSLDLGLLCGFFSCKSQHQQEQTNQSFFLKTDKTAFTESVIIPYMFEHNVHILGDGHMTVRFPRFGNLEG